MQQQKFTPRPTTILSDFRYDAPRTEQPVEGAKYPATWMWATSASGAIHFKVNDGVYGKDDPNQKYKEVEMGHHDRGVLFNLMEEACRNPDFTKAQYKVRKRTFGAGGRMNDQPSTLAAFAVIRKDGKIYVTYSRSVYKVTFAFTSPFESELTLLDANGQPSPDSAGILSRMYCKSFVDYSRKFLDEYEWNNYKPRERKDNNGGGYNNNNNNYGGGRNGNQSYGGNNNGGGNSAPANDFDDDIDF